MGLETGQLGWKVVSKYLPPTKQVMVERMKQEGRSETCLEGKAYRRWPWAKRDDRCHFRPGNFHVVVGIQMEVTCRQVLRRYRNVGRRSELEAEAYRSLIDVLSWEINVREKHKGLKMDYIF